MNDIQQINNELEQCTARITELQSALEARKAEMIIITADQVRDLIEINGVTLADVLSHLVPADQPRQKAKRAKMNSRRWIDPETGVGYVRGPAPLALKQRMAEMGFSGSFKAWRDQHMQIAN